jgi:adenylate cyclase
MLQRLLNRGSKSRLAVLFAICLFFTLLLGALQLMPGRSNLNSALRDADFYLQDLFVRHGRFAEADPRLVLIGIDRPSYGDVIRENEAGTDPVLAALRGRFPWSRRVWAALIERLSQAGAKAIVIDLVFNAEAEGDPELSAALKSFGDKVVIGSNFSPVETDRGVLSQLTAPAEALVATNIPALDSRVGYVNIWTSEDDVFRRAQFRISNHEMGDVVNTLPQTMLLSLDARAIQKVMGDKFLDEVPLSARIRFAGPPGEVFEMHPVGDVLTPRIFATNYNNGKFFKGKIVLVGPTANIFQDYHRTPFRQDMAGPEIHLNIMNAALGREFLREIPRSLSAVILLLYGLIAAGLCGTVRQPIKRLGAALILCGLGLATTWACFNYGNVVVPSVAPLLVLFFSALAALAYDFLVERVEKIKLRHTMGLYFSPRVLEAVLANPGSMAPRRAEVVLLLTDLRNSTPLAEALGPEGMFSLLNQVFEAQTNAIMSEEGNLEHFLGDQFLSYWGAPQAQPQAANQAERAAIKLITAMETLQKSLPASVQQLFGYGVALHSGSVLVGNKGSALRLDYGLVGDAVNEAARIEALTKYYQVKLLISRNTFSQLDRQGARRLVDRVIVKGKTEPVELFESQNPCTPEDYPTLCANYKAAYDDYFFGRFESAAEKFVALVERFSDGPSRTLADRCRWLLANPPAPWQGIWRLDSK